MHAENNFFPFSIYPEQKVSEKLLFWIERKPIKFYYYYLQAINR
ncbi:hypothetical protein DB41_AM00020 [Neochlamydia sp. TUME1]|nr:hypothetical protein DB41_AM00020 [Neochlamydia sp. TUME1]